MYTCGGIAKPAAPAYTAVSPGESLPLTWEMGLWTGIALHQGLVEASISMNGDNGPWTQLKVLSLVGDSTVDTTPHGMSVTLPSTLECAAVGGCTLQWRWNASVTPERFVNCADLMTSNTSQGKGTVSVSSIPVASSIATPAKSAAVSAQSTATPYTKTATRNRGQCSIPTSTITVTQTPTAAQTSSSSGALSMTPAPTSTTSVATTTTVTSSTSSGTCAAPTTVTLPASTVISTVYSYMTAAA